MKFRGTNLPSSAWSATAHADATGYVCQSGWVVNPGPMAPWLSGTGNAGLVYTYVYSAPGCEGTQAGFCTVGATNSKWCTSVSS